MSDKLIVTQYSRTKGCTATLYQDANDTSSWYMRVVRDTEFLPPPVEGKIKRKSKGKTKRQE